MNINELMLLPSLRYLIFIEASILQNIVGNPWKSVTSYLLMNINELMLLPCILEFKVFDLH